MFFGPLLLLWVVMMVVIIGGLVLWIVTLVEVVQLPDHTFRAAATEKVTWGLVVGLTGWIGALIWLFGPRQRHGGGGHIPGPARLVSHGRWAEVLRRLPLAPHGPALGTTPAGAGPAVLSSRPLPGVGARRSWPASLNQWNGNVMVCEQPSTRQDGW